MPQFSITHITQYIYNGNVHDSANQIILYPIEDEFQEVYKHDIKITGDPIVYIHKDFYGNDIGSFTLREPHLFLDVVSNLNIVTHPRPLPLDNIFSKEQWNELDKLQNELAFLDYLYSEDFENVNEVLEVVSSEVQNTPFKTALQFCRYVYENFEYLPGVTTVETTLEEAWKLKAGVCQDFAHILLLMLRRVKIPARYVSGYVCPNKNGMRGEGATHAWVEAYIPNHGWMGIDPTNNCIVNDLHVRLAVGRSFSDCSPVKGVYKGNPEHELKVLVTVAYQGEEPPKSVSELPHGNKIVAARNSYEQYQEIMEQQQQQQQ